MIKYRGDISSADAELLKYFAEISKNILEFGVGASTQVIRNYSNGEMLSIETSNEWIETVKWNLDVLKINKPITFELYDDFVAKEPSQKYDFIFNDGVDGYRKDFGVYAFDKLLKPNGYLLFHDQRRSQDIANMIEVIRVCSAWIDAVQINYQGSNITIIHKRETPLFYSNWNEDEKRSAFMSAYTEGTAEEIENYKNEING